MVRLSHIQASNSHPSRLFPSIPFPSASVPNAPVPNAPVPNAPASNASTPNAPAPSTPFHSSPFHSSPFHSTPVPSPPFLSSLVPIFRHRSYPTHQHINCYTNNSNYPDRPFVLRPVVSKNDAKYDSPKIPCSPNSARHDTWENNISKNFPAKVLTVIAYHLPTDRHGAQ